VTIKYFSLKIRSSTAIATLCCLKKVSLILPVGLLSNCVSSIGCVFRSVVGTHFDHPESKCWISTTVQAIPVVLSRVDALFKHKSAAVRILFLSRFFIELRLSQDISCFLRYFFPILLVIFKEIQYLCYRLESQRDIIGIDEENKVLCLDTKFVFLFVLVVEL